MRNCLKEIQVRKTVRVIRAALSYLEETMDYKIVLRWFEYVLPNGRKVFLTNRPDRIDDGSVETFILRERPIVRFMFTDDLVEPPPNGPVWHWHPWVPGKGLPQEHVFAFLCEMMRYNEASDIAQAIWLHCDSSTMRAPTFFGCFLFAVYGEDKAKEIVSRVRYSPDRDLKMPLYESPIDYAQTSMNRDPGIRELISAWNIGGEREAYTQYMKID
jgi:hypothetical protein